MPGGHRSPEPTVAMGVDLARVHDFSVIIGLSKTRRITYYDRFQRISWPLQKARIHSAYLKLGKPRTLIDWTGIGDPIVQDLVRMGMIRASGVLFTPKSKGELIDGLAAGIEKGEVGLIDNNQILNELEAFEFTTTKAGNIRYSAPDGLYDDTVCALALAYRAVRRGADTGISL
jgi:phage FluMu gp28-like protein